VLPGLRVSAAPRYLALPHPPAARRAPLSSGPTCQPSRPSTVTWQRRRPRPPARGRCWPPQPFPHRAWAPSSFPFLPSMWRPPSDPLPPSFPLYHAPERVQKASAAVPLSSPLCSFAPRSSMPPPPKSFPESAHRPRTRGPCFLSLISPETSPPSAFTGEPLAKPRLALLDPHLTLLYLPLWCRTWAASSTTTGPAPPPLNATNALLLG
jgi:hypothetical protein